MKKLLVVAALTAAAAPAMASKARVNALGNSRQVVDFQTAFDRPYQFMALGTMVTLEWGSNDTFNGTAMTPSNPHAEGGFLMKHDDYSYGAYLGRRSDAFEMAVNNSGLTGAMHEQNPINLYYASKMGDWSWGVTAKYSNGTNEVPPAELKSTSSGISVGATNGTFDIDLVQGISGKSEVGANSVESKGMTDLTVGYHMDPSMEVYANYSTLKADTTTGGTTSSTTDGTVMELGFVNQVSTTDDATFFYGIAYNNTKFDKGGPSALGPVEISALPVWMGIEANATSWMVMRASVRQNIILNDAKFKTGTGDKKADIDGIAFAAGAGFRLGKGMLDATFGTANQGHLSFSDGTGTNQFLSNVAYTYIF